MKSASPNGQEKRCPDCGVMKPLTEFWANRATPDGRYVYCKACGGRRNAANAERRRLERGQAPPKSRAPREVLPAGTKRCPDCQAVLQFEAFVRQKSRKDGIGSYCRQCQNKRVWESRYRLHGGSRHYHLRRRYGIGADEVLQLMDQQQWTCPICLGELSEKTAHVDHDHRTGRVRAVLCFNCNGGLGQFKDDPASLRRAAAYVEGRVWQPTQVAPDASPRPTSLPAARRSPSSSVITLPTSSRAVVRPLQPR